MRRCRLVIAMGVYFAAIICAAEADAQTLAPHDVYAQRSPSVVFFRSKQNNVGMSFGVLISKDGYVLTAKHVVDAFEGEAVRARIGSGGGADLLDFEEKVRNLPELDVSLLKLKNPPAGLQPAPIGKADHFRAGSTKVEILTGFAEEKTATPLSATISNSIDGKPDLWNVQGTGVDRGHSGSPAFDQFGNVVGFIPTGYAGTGIFQLRTLDSIYGWLKLNNVNIEQRVKPDKFMVFVRSRGQEALGGAMQRRLGGIIEQWLGINRADIESEPPFMPELLRRWEKPNDRVLKTEVNELGSDWVAERDARRLYLYVVQLQFGPDGRYPDSAKQFLVTLEHDGTEVATNLLPLNETTLRKPRLDREIDDDQEEKLFTDNAFLLLNTAAQSRGTRFRKNGFVLAECLNTEAVPAPLAEKVREWGYEAAQRLKDELDKVWQKESAYQSYRLASMIPSKCGQSGFFNDKNKEQIERENRQQKAMAELIIQSRIKEVDDAEGLSILWQLRKDRADDERQAKNSTRVKLGGDDFALGLARSIIDNWADMAGNLKE